MLNRGHLVNSISFTCAAFSFNLSDLIVILLIIMSFFSVFKPFAKLMILLAISSAVSVVFKLFV